MTKSDLEKIREELKKQKEQNDNNILLYDERTRMAQVSQFKSKAEHTLAFSTISYFALLSASAVLINKIGADTFTSIIPAVSYSPILALGSVSIGSIIKGVMDKKFKTKERFKAFSTAKTQAEKLEEEIYYQIELEKTENRNKVIDETISILNSKEIMLWKRSVNYDINVKDLSEEEMRKAIDDLSEYIKTQYSKLDLLTAQKILHDRFRDTRATEYKIGDMIVATGSSIIVPGFLSVFPNLLLKDNMFTYGSTSLALVASFTPLIAGVAGVSIYKAKRGKDHKKAFQKLNATLEEDALSDRISIEALSEEGENLSLSIKNQIRDISLLEAKLQEKKRILGTLTTEEDEDKIADMLFAPHQKVKITDKTKEDVLSHPEKYTDCDARIRLGKFYTDEEYERYVEESLSRPLPGEEKGPTLVKRRKKTNPNK